MRVLLSLGAAVVALVIAAPSAAGVITRTYNFTFQDFVPAVPGPVAPVDPITGSFTVTFDPTVAVYDTTAGLTVHSLNLPVPGYLAYSFTPFGELSLGAIVGPFDQVASLTWGTDDFYMAFFHPLSNPIAPSAGYTRAGVQDFFDASQGSVTARTAVPEPAMWALLLAGFGAMGARLRRKPRAA